MRAGLAAFAVLSAGALTAIVVGIESGEDNWGASVASTIEELQESVMPAVADLRSGSFTASQVTTFNREFVSSLWMTSSESGEYEAVIYRDPDALVRGLGSDPSDVETDSLPESMVALVGSDGMLLLGTESTPWKHQPTSPDFTSPLGVDLRRMEEGAYFEFAGHSGTSVTHQDGPDGSSIWWLVTTEDGGTVSQGWEIGADGGLDVYRGDRETLQGTWSIVWTFERLQQAPAVVVPDVGTVVDFGRFSPPADLPRS